tara:strand:+ start:34281 stop:34463 length:183 start_codon:yes stop_codon:yes gene_type:complete
MLKKILLAVVTAIALSISLVSIFTFLGVSVESYANWIFWMDALVVFYIILPSKQNTIFSA